MTRKSGKVSYYHYSCKIIISPSNDKFGKRSDGSSSSKDRGRSRATRSDSDDGSTDRGRPRMKRAVSYTSASSDESLCEISNPRPARADDLDRRFAELGKCKYLTLLHVSNGANFNCCYQRRVWKPKWIIN
jgi:hypothetical protein